jgi:hypothetical protein
MNIELLNLDAQALRNLLVQETKKFLRALEDGSSISDLESIRLNIREISSILEKKERNSSNDDSSVAA